MSAFIGKHICYGDEKGKFLFGKIKSETQINTVHGLKDAFIVEGIMLGPYGEAGVKGIRRTGDRLIRKDKLNLKTDIIDLDFEQGKSILEYISDEQLFLLSLDFSDGGGDLDGSILHRGMKNMLLAQCTDALPVIVTRELKRRLGIDVDQEGDEV